MIPKLAFPVQSKWYLVIGDAEAPQNVLTCHYRVSDGKVIDIQWPFHHCYIALLHPSSTQVIRTNDTTPARAPMSHTSQPFYFKLLPLSAPLLAVAPSPASLPPSFHAWSLCPFQHPPRSFHLPVFLLSATCLCPSVRYLRVCMSYSHSFHHPPPPPLTFAPLCPSHSLCLFFLLHFVPVWHMLRLASRFWAAVGPVHFTLCEDGRLKSPPGIFLCQQRLASTVLQTRC